MRMYKAYATVNQSYDALILGSSRALLFDSQHESFENYNAYNLALANGSLFEAYKYFQHTVYGNSNKIKLAILEVQCCGFGGGPDTNYDKNRLVLKQGKTHTFERLQAYLKDAVPALISIDALRESKNVLKTNKRIAQYGSDHKLAWHKLRVKRAGGHKNMFNRLMAKYSIRTPQENKIIPGGELMKIMHLARRNNIELIIYMSPFHASFEEHFRRISNGKTSDSWKRSLVKLNDSIAAEYKQSPYKIWDFTGYNTVTTETIPPINDTNTLMKWHWDGSHLTTTAGNLILDKIMGYQHSTRVVPDDFGTLINASNIDFHLKAEKVNRAKYQDTIVNANAHLLTN